MSPETAEFRDADALLQDALPSLPLDAPLSAIRALVLPPASSKEKETADQPIPPQHLPPSSCMVWQRETLFQVDRLLVTPDTPPLVAITSGISRRDLGSGGKCWDGSLALARWIARRAAASESPVAGKRVLELGAGCSGLPGIVACRDGGAASVVLSEGPEVLVEMLRRNAAINIGGERAANADISARQLVWTRTKVATGGGGVRPVEEGGAAYEAPSTSSISTSTSDEGGKGNRSVGRRDSEVETTEATSVAADVILAAEPIWAGCDPVPLVETIQRCLLLGGSTGVCFIVMPRGGRGVEERLVREAQAIGLLWSSSPLPVLTGPWALEQNGVEESSPSWSQPPLETWDEWDDEFLLHEFRCCPPW